MKILRYSEALEKSENKDWFKSFYNENDYASDEEVAKINQLALGKEKLMEEYFEDTHDILLQKEYVLDLIDFLENPYDLND
jgi:hypothetical protein